MKKISSLLLVVFLLIAAGCSDNSSTETEAQGSEGDTASNFPEEPIEMILPFPTGGAYTNFGRILAETVEKYLPNEQSVAVVNRDGGNNTVGLVELMQADPDGHTIGFVPTSSITNTPHFGDTPYTYEDFAPVVRVLQLDGYMFVKSDAPWETFEEWAEFVKENPGEFTIGALPPAKAVMTKLNKEIEGEVSMVPFDGFADGMTAFLGGHTMGIQATKTTEAKGLLESGQIRPLWTVSDREDLEVPTLLEKGIDLAVTRMVGVIAPKDVPEERLAILEEAFQKALEDPELLKEYEKLGVEPYFGDSEDFQKSLEETFERDGKLLKESGLIE